MEENWRVILGSVSTVVILVRDWFAFNFGEVELVKKVLARNWSLDHTPLFLKPWDPMFDASRERIDVMSVWVHLSKLPLNYWIDFHFWNIGIMLGHFLEVDDPLESH